MIDPGGLLEVMYILEGTNPHIVSRRTEIKPFGWRGFVFEPGGHESEK